MNESDLLSRIHEIYTSCTKKEQYYLRKILEELSLYGYSDTYNNIWLSDYKEIPVSIDRFISDDMYLGGTNRNGEAVYPFWKTVLSEIFTSGNKYEEIFFTGATRIGKSSTAITGTAYMLYKLMCLRDPQEYFGKKDVSKFSILFFNITKDLAKGVAFREFNDTLRNSPWFCSHGGFSKSERNFYYIPEGGKVVIDFGSDAVHALGQQVFVGFCLTGDTRVIHNGYETKICDLCSYDSTPVLGYTANGSRYVDNNGIHITRYVNDTISIILEDGTKIEGTPDHRLLMSDGTYKMLKDIQEGDDIMEAEVYKDIPGYEGIYKVSNFGSVVSCSRKIKQKMPWGDREIEVRERIISPDSASYPYVTLNRDGVSKNFYVPHLVLSAFKSDEYDGTHFYHEDRDTSNNKLSNLRCGFRDLGPDYSPVPGTDNLIYVSTKGDVYSHTYTYSVGSKVLVNVEHLVNQGTDKYGYKYVDISRFPNLHFVHRIVAMTYISGDDTLTVNHIDGDKSNNCIENLEWATAKEQVHHAFKLGLRDKLSEIAKCKKMSEKNSHIIRCKNTGRQYSSIADAARQLGLSDEGIRLSIVEKRSMKSGLVFELVENES